MRVSNVFKLLGMWWGAIIVAYRREGIGVAVWMAFVFPSILLLVFGLRRKVKRFERGGHG